jgi:hypothetical protein
MAKLTSLLSFSGTLDGVSVYQMNGVDRPVVRKKGGPSKETIQTAKSCANQRRTGKEFGGRGKATGLLNKALLSLGALKDLYCIGNLNTRLVPLQELDTVSAWGQRHVLLSKRPQLLEGFELARSRPFDAVVQNPVSYTLSKDLGTAHVEVPALLPGINLTPRGSSPFFRVLASLGVVPDMLFDKMLNNYLPAERFSGVLAQETQTGWMVVKSGAPAITLELTLPYKPKSTAYSLVLTVGIEFGTVGRSGAVERVKRTGSAKILAMA